MINKISIYLILALLLILGFVIDKNYPQAKFKDSKTIRFQKDNEIIKLKFTDNY